MILINLLETKTNKKGDHTTHRQLFYNPYSFIINPKTLKTDCFISHCKPIYFAIFEYYFVFTNVFQNKYLRMLELVEMLKKQ